MAKIDIDKFVCALIKDRPDERCCYDFYLQKQGLRYDDEKEEIVSIEPQQDTSELTEFELHLKELIEQYTYALKNNFDCTSTHDIALNAKIWGKELLSIARKQIAEEIRPEQMVLNYAKEASVSPCNHIIFHYRRGIEDAIKKVKNG